MAEGEGDGEDRTEAASARRLQRAREQGHVPLSREVGPLAALGAVTLALMIVGPASGRTLTLRLRDMLAESGEFDPSGAHALIVARHAVSLVAATAGPLVLAAVLPGAAATLLQSNFLLSTASLMPDFARLDPRRGLRRVAGRETLVQLVKALAKAGVLGFAMWRVLKSDLPALFAAPLWQPELLWDRLARELARLLLLLAGAQALIAGLDLLWVRYTHAASLRMSKQELKEEHKETEGNPQIKGRLRQLARQRARRRMMAAVPKAAVVVTNPTHYAVALAYERGGKGAPRVVAKGLDEIAAKIREVAEAHKIPLVANPPLARALYRVELDMEIPAEHFRAVAEIIAYVWRLRPRTAPRR